MSLNATSQYGFPCWVLQMADGLGGAGHLIRPRSDQETMYVFFSHWLNSSSWQPLLTSGYLDLTTSRSSTGKTYVGLFPSKVWVAYKVPEIWPHEHCRQRRRQVTIQVCTNGKCVRFVGVAAIAAFHTIQVRDSRLDCRTIPRRMQFQAVYAQWSC